MKIARLRNGTEEAEPGVRVMMVTLSDLMEKDPILFYELVEKCKDRNHEMWGDCGVKLQQMSLLESTGTVHETVRNIVLSAVKGEGLDMSLVNPILSTREAA